MRLNQNKLVNFSLSYPRKHYLQ